MGRRRGTSLLEALLGFVLAVGILALVLGAYRFFSGRAATQTADLGRIREATLYVERLRRTLKAGAVRVIPTARGFRVIHWRRAPNGDWELVESVFERAVEDGVLVIVSPDGSRTRYEVGVKEGEKLELKADEKARLIKIAVGGVVVVQRLGAEVSPRGVERPRILEATGGLTLEEVRDQLRTEEETWDDPPELPPLGEPDESPTGFSVSPEEDREGEVSRSPRALQVGFDDEVDVVGMEASGLGQVFLPPRPPPSGRPTALEQMRSAARDAGLSEALAEAAAGALSGWEAGVLTGERRQAAEALRGLKQVAAAAGLDDSGLADLLRRSSRLAEEIWKAHPDPTGALGGTVPVSLPDSLGNGGVELPEEPPGEPPEAPAGAPPGAGSPPPTGTPPRTRQQIEDANALLLDFIARCQQQAVGAGAGAQQTCQQGEDRIRSAIQDPECDLAILNPCMENCRTDPSPIVCMWSCDEPACP